MLSQPTFHRIFRASAFYDLVVSAPFALAPGVWAIWAGLNALTNAMGLQPLPPLDSHGMMFANFFGSIVTLWSLLRLKLNADWLARWDAMGRVSFSVAMMVALTHGASPVLWPMLVLEILWGILQLLPVQGQRWRLV